MLSRLKRYWPVVLTWLILPAAPAGAAPCRPASALAAHGPWEPLVECRRRGCG